MTNRKCCVTLGRAMSSYRLCVVFRCDLNEPGESIVHRSRLSELYTDGPHT